MKELKYRKLGYRCKVYKPCCSSHIFKCTHIMLINYLIISTPINIYTSTKYHQDMPSYLPRIREEIYVILPIHIYSQTFFPLVTNFYFIWIYVFYFTYFLVFSAITCTYRDIYAPDLFRLICLNVKKRFKIYRVDIPYHKIIWFFE